MLTFGIPLLIQLFWLNLSFEEKLSLAYRVGRSFVVCYTHVGHFDKLLALHFYHERYERNATQCSIDDITRIHKRLCQQLFSTSEALKIWFVAHWFFLAIFLVIFVAEIISLFKYASDWFFFYEFAL